MLRKIRIAFAAICFTLLTLLFLDFTGTVHAWFGWMAKVQFLPALLATNFVVVAALLVLTLIFGRVYCSVICPLGVMQDIFGAAGRRRRKNRYGYSPATSWLRYGMLVIFIVALAAGTGLIIHKTALLIAPYSAFGRIVSNLFAPLWQAGNNLLAYISARIGSYAFYSVDVWVKSVSTFAVAAVTFVVIGTLAWRNGRTWCNTVCPVGTVLGFFARFSLFRPVIDTSKCNACGLCAHNCKAACIDPKAHAIDYSRCVACMDCIDNCRHGAISYKRRELKTAVKALDATETAPQTAENTAQTVAAGTTPAAPTSETTKTAAPPTSENGISRRKFLSLTALAATSAAVKAQEKKVDGGLAVIVDKKIPERKTHIVPAGSGSIRHFAAHCTGCQLCVSVCPNGVLRPSSNIATLMQPEMSYERGYCRPECTKCSEVCPAGAIVRIDAAEKSSTQIGRAVWIKENCVPLTDGVECGNCARHCPSGAITMIPSDPSDEGSPKVPAVNTERCIGCGACENLCPARPFSAIYVEGNENHRTV